jgi:inner membrane protease subunit 1
MASRFRDVLYRFRPPPLFSTAVRTVQILAGLHLLSTTVAELRICSGFSMLPTLSHDGDCVLVSPLPYWSWFSGSSKIRGPKRGDLVVATSPTDPSATVCKRVIGIEGDLIEVDPRRGGKRKWLKEVDEVHVADEPLGGESGSVSRRLDSEGRPMTSRRKGEEQWVRVPKGHVWLAGDNMSNSTDSRMYGPVPLAIVKGKVLARVSVARAWFRAWRGVECGADDPRCIPTSNGWMNLYGKSTDSSLPDSLHSIDTLHVAYYINQQHAAA